MIWDFKKEKTLYLLTEREKVKFLSVGILNAHFSVSIKNQMSTLLIAACLHDIAKLRTAAIDIDVNDEFIYDLTLLHQADDAGSVRRDEDLVGIEERCEHAYQLVCGL